MRVLFVTNMWPDAKRPWYGTFVKTQADSLGEVGVEVDVLPIRGYESKLAYGRAVPEVMRIRRGQFDVIHAHYGHAAVVGRVQRAAPLVVSYCGDDLLGTPGEDGSMTRQSRLESAVFCQIARVAAATITKSAEMERRLPQRTRAHNHVIPNGVDTARFKPRSRDEARASLGWPQHERTVLFAGDPRIPRKNYALAQAACQRAATSIPELSLRIASGFLPSEVPTLMNAADVLLLTSLSEGSPNVVKEAMASELPVVATPSGDVEERLGGVPGCFVRAFDADGLSEGLIEALRHGRTPAARAAVAPLSLGSVARRLIEVYAEVSTGARTSAPVNG